MTRFLSCGFSAVIPGLLARLQKALKVPSLTGLGRRGRSLLCNLSRHELGAAKVFFVLVTLALISSGCAKQGWESDIDPSAVACRSTYGFSPGSPEYDQCIQKLKAARGQ